MRTRTEPPWVVLILILVAGLVPRASATSGLKLEHPESRELVALVARAVELVEGRGMEVACGELKRQDGPWLEADSYVFVLTADGTSLCHPARPALEGRNLEELHDPDDRPILQLMLEQLADGSEDGWIHYLWPRPEDSVLSWKSTYLRRAEGVQGRELIVASGVYRLPVEKLFVVERVEAAAKLLAARGRQAFSTLRDRASGFIFLDTYVYVMSMDQVMLVNPAFPRMEGERVGEVEDTGGRRPADEILALLAERDSGWVSYRWPRPGERRPARKEAYVRKIRLGDEDVVVAAGIYLED